MATPAQTQVTLDASQFISAVDHIGNSITAMNQSLASAGVSFNKFAASATNIESTLTQISASMNANVAATNATTAAIKQLTTAYGSTQNVMTQIAISTRAAAQSLDALANVSTKTGQAGVRSAQQFTFAWDGILRLLAVTAVRRIFLDIAGAMQQAVTAAADYGEQVGRILAVNQNLGDTVEQLSQRFSNLSLAFGRPLAEVAEAAKQAVQSGIAQTGQQVEQVTSAVARLAEVTGTTMPQSMTATVAVMRAFKLEASEAQNVTNQLFHMMQQGIGVNEIGSSIGRVSAQAQRLGVSFAELGLLMEEIKATGVSDAEVMTQVAAVMNSLERPTQRFQELMGQNGFFSPQQLIQAQRLHGALQLINQDISEGNIQAREAVQSRRAGGGLSVADSFANRSTNNPLNNVAGLEQGTQSAMRLVDATGRWNDELQKIKTIFEGEIGPAIIKTILRIFDNMGGLGEAVVNAGRQIALLVEPVARVINGFALWGSWIERIAEGLGILNAANRINIQTMRQFNEAAREGGERLNTWISTQRQSARDALQQGTQNIANFFTPINSALSRQGELQRERVHNLAADIEASSKSVFTGFAAQIDSLESAAKQAESRISESLKRVAELGDKTDRDAFQNKLRTAGDVTQTSRFNNPAQAANANNLLQAQNRGADNQINLIASRRQRLNDEIQQLQARGDADSIAAARRKFEELRQLNNQEMDIRAAAARRRAEFDARVSGGNQVFNPFNREREEGARRLDQAERAFEEANRRRLSQQQQQLEAINRQLREQLRLAQDGQRDIGRLPQQLLTPQGTPRQDFQGVAGGERATGVINRTIDAEIARLRQLPETIERGIRDALARGAITPEQADQARRRAPGQDEILRLIQQLEQQRTATQGVFANAEARRVSEQLQRDQIAVLQRIATNTELALQRVSDTRQEQRSALQGAQERLNDLRGQVPSNLAIRLQNSDAGRTDRADALREAIIQADRRVQTATRTQDQGDIRQAEQAVRAVLEAAQRSQRDGIGGISQGTITRLENILFRLRESLDARPQQEANLGGAQQVQNQVNQAIQNANPGGIPPATIQQSITALDTLSTSLNPGGAFPNALTSLADSTAIAARQIAAATANLNGALPETSGGDFASGGLIGNIFSNFGPDNTRINARRGEFVVNPESTRKFYATLVAINRGDSPRGGGYAHGGTVTNTIGNMHFHVNGAEHPEQTARSVMKIIRREQRRGNV